MTWEQAVLNMREQPEHRDLVRACFYDDPVLGAAERYYRSPEWTALRALLPRPPGDALDVGAGRGIASFALARDGWHVVAVEPDPSDVVGAGAIRALAAAANLSIDIRMDRGERLPFEDASFDVVLGRAVMHHARDLRAFCREAARVLRPGGVFLAAREHVLSRDEDRAAFLACHPLHRYYGGENAYRLGQYREAIRGAGLRLARTLNPWASDVNLFPATRDQLRNRIAARLHVPAAMIPGAVLTLAGALRREPGRLYTFVARRQRA
jgi:SAM-dependent methyltransferase